MRKIIGYGAVCGVTFIAALSFITVLIILVEERKIWARR